MRKVIKNGTIVNEGRRYMADVIINGDRIEAVVNNADTEGAEVIDAAGMLVLPGAIDDQVHFREPGLTHKGDIAEGSHAAAAGGVTSFMDMPNVNPATTTIANLLDKQAIAAANSVVNYSFFMGATVDNIDEIKRVDPLTTCGVKVFMGSSTGNMLVDREEALERLFAESPILIATHCEDTPTINANMAKFKEEYGDNIPPSAHPLIRSREACYKSSATAAALARKHGTKLHILHLSTADELPLLDQGPRAERRVTGEVCVHHLWFNDSAYATKGNLVKWNPAIKTEADREALVQAINDDTIFVVATDHAPHLLREKEGPYTHSASGGPMVQHSLLVMLELAHRGETTIENVVDKMAHGPAELFEIEDRGFIRPGYKADIVLVANEPWTVTKDNILYRCGWSPLEGQELQYKVINTFVNGRKIYDRGEFNDTARGELLRFKR
ncbi:MAG: dihydroorotase [Marinifilaceae bacterium]